MATEYAHQPQVKPINFFKIITNHNLHEGKLMVPNKIVEKYGEGLPNTLFLRTPNGAEWEMNLKKCDGKIWFQKGWKEFAEHHSLAHGHLLVFRCQGTSRFQVHICDSSALEIDYPSKRIEGKMAPKNNGNEPPNDEKLEYQRAGQKRKDKSLVEFRQSYNLRRSKCVKVENNLILQKQALHHSTDSTYKEKSKATTYQVTALERASSFKPRNPFFLVVMRPYYIGFRGTLNLPTKFCRRHFDLHTKQRLVNLQVLNERVWPAKLLLRKRKTLTKFRFSSGWRAFVKHYNLKVDDVCIFELIHRTKLTFLVHIFREKDNSYSSTSQENSKPAANQVSPLSRANSFKPCNPYFLLVMHPYHVGSFDILNLPSKFCSKHFDLGTKQRLVNLQVLNGRVWPAKFLIRKRRMLTKFTLSSGWKAFFKHYNLKVGDVCVFELIHRTKLTFLVHIFRETENSNCSTSQEKSNSAANQVTALDRANSLKPCNPNFLAVMHPSYILANRLTLPSKFCKRHFDMHKQQTLINLQVLNGRAWPAKIMIYTDNMATTRFRLSSKWMEFVKHNNLKVGDVCVFELILRTKLTFLVHIFRKTESSNCSTSKESGQMRTACQGQRKAMKTITATK